MSYCKKCKIDSYVLKAQFLIHNIIKNHECMSDTFENEGHSRIILSPVPYISIKVKDILSLTKYQINKFISPTVDRTVSKIPRKGQISLQGVVQTTSMTSRRCHRQRRHALVLLTTKTTLKSTYLLKIKALEKKISHYTPEGTRECLFHKKMEDRSLRIFDKYCSFY